MTCGLAVAILDVEVASFVSARLCEALLPGGRDDVGLDVHAQREVPNSLRCEQRKRPFAGNRQLAGDSDAGIEKRTALRI